MFKLLKLRGLARVVVAVFAVIVSTGLEAGAITLDEFSGSAQFVTADSNGSSSKAVSTGAAIGNARSLFVKSLSASSAPIDLRTTSSAVFPYSPILGHSQGVGVKGFSRIVWDGDPINPDAIDFDGLGGIDLTQDGASAIIMPIDEFDAPGSNSLRISITVYDASTSDGSKRSSNTFLVNDGTSQPIVEFPFDGFVASGPGGAVDWTNVGAIEITINDPLNPLVAADISFFKLSTNGSCPLIPKIGQKVVDICGVCGGDGTSCLDCNGVPFGSAQIDQCGICGGDGTSCLDCNNIPFGSAQLDPCGICNGDGTSCQDCNGVTFGGASFDQCGVCGGDGTSCLDCNGTVNGAAVLDSCGICGGDGSSCLDCNGIKFGTAKLDRCAVCNGDGQSCLGCVEADQKPLLTALDGGAKAQERIAKKVAKKLLANVKTPEQENLVMATLAKIHKLQIRNWTISWHLPQTTRSCQNTEFCVAASTTSITDEYRRNNTALRNATLVLIRMLERSSKKRQNQFKTEAQRQFEKNIALADQVPVKQFSCQ